MPGRDDRHTAQIRATAAARNEALRRLREAHREEYDRLYTEECAKRGVTARVARAKSVGSDG